MWSSPAPYGMPLSIVCSRLRSGLDPRHAVVEPQAGAMPLVDRPGRLPGSSTLPACTPDTDTRSPSTGPLVDVLAVEVAPGVRQRVGAADVGARPEAIGRLARDAPDTAASVRSPMFTMKRQVELLAEAVGAPGRSSRSVLRACRSRGSRGTRSRRAAPRARRTDGATPPAYSTRSAIADSRIRWERQAASDAVDRQGRRQVWV